MYTHKSCQEKILPKKELKVLYVEEWRLLTFILNNANTHKNVSVHVESNTTEYTEVVELRQSFSCTINKVMWCVCRSNKISPSF